MFSNKSFDSSASSEKSNLRSFYDRFQSFLGRNCESDRKEDMFSTRASTDGTDETFITPVSSVDDLMALSPKKTKEEQPDVTSDFLTGSDFDSICDVTMQEIPSYDDMFNPSSLDYLIKCTDTNRKHNQVDRGKESLFVKFDPLYASKFESNSSTQIDSVSETNDGDCGYETGSAASVFTDVASPKHSVSDASLQSLASRIKPTQAVPPVVKSENRTSSSDSHPPPTLVRSVSAIITPTQVATERLISISGNTPPTAAPRSHESRYHHFGSQSGNTIHALRNMLQKQDQDILALRQENRELKSSLQECEHKHTETIEHLEASVQKLTKEKEHFMHRENKLLQQIHDKALSNRQMSIVMEEYEKTISSLIGDQQRYKINNQELMEKLSAERDQALNHLSNMECSFNDLLSKYEKCKSVILEMKEREKSYEERISEYEAGLKKYESLYENLKQVTSDSLAKANETLDNLKKSHSSELTKMNAIIKKYEINMASLQESVAQKTRDNEELTRICDQLINEVR